MIRRNGTSHLPNKYDFYTEGESIFFPLFSNCYPLCSSSSTHVRNSVLMNVWSDSKLLNSSPFFTITSLQRSSWNIKVLTLATFEKSSFSFGGCVCTHRQWEPVKSLVFRSTQSICSAPLQLGTQSTDEAGKQLNALAKNYCFDKGLPVGHHAGFGF